MVFSCSRPSYFWLIHWSCIRNMKIYRLQLLCRRLLLVLVVSFCIRFFADSLLIIHWRETISFAYFIEFRLAACSPNLNTDSYTVTIKSSTLLFALFYLMIAFLFALSLSLSNYTIRFIHNKCFDQTKNSQSHGWWKVPCMFLYIKLQLPSIYI